MASIKSCLGLVVACKRVGATHSPTRGCGATHSPCVVGGNKSHLSWAGGSENRVGEGQAACVLPTFEVQARSAGLHEQGAGVRLGPHRCRNLQQDQQENKSPHTPASHLRQAATNDEVKQERSPYIFANLHTYKPTPVAQSWAIMSREANQEEQTLGARGGKRDLAFASRTMSSPRSFAVLSGT